MSSRTKKGCPPLIKGALCLILAVALMAVIIPEIANTSEAAPDTIWYDGSGNYTIGTADELAGLAQLVNNGNDFSGATITLTSDIDLASYASGWIPIGIYDPLEVPVVEYQFRGIFDGNNHIIQNLTVTGLGYDVGLFGYVGAGGVVENLGIESGTVNGVNNVGGVVGYLEDGYVTNCYNASSVRGDDGTGAGGNAGGVVGGNWGTVTNCYNTGTITGCWCIGGVVGTSYGSMIGCYNTGSVIGDNDEVGGVVGEFGSGDMTNCYNTGPVSGDNTVGGVAGIIYDYCTAANCYNSGSVSSETSYSGGITGENYRGIITNCYNTGPISGANKTGGIAGGNVGSIAVVTNCFSTGTVSSDNVTYLGGIAGQNSGTLTSCYYNSDTGINNGLGTGLTTIQMIGADALTNYMSDLNSDSAFVKSRTYTDDFCYYPELKVFYSGTDQQKTNSEVSVRVDRIATTITAAPVASDVAYGDKLNTSALSGGAATDITGTIPLDGTFAWTDGTIIAKSTAQYGYTFTPSASYNYLYKNSSSTITADVTGVTEPVVKYQITAIADDGSVISPSGVITAQKGNTRVFTFSAQDGYYIASVLVDDKPLSQAQIDLGTYTFKNVTANHYIQVTSQMVDVTLTISISPGNGGYAEYSIDGGSTFMLYDGVVTIPDPASSDIVVRAHNNSGYSFDRWVYESTESDTSDLSLGTLESSAHVYLYFTGGATLPDNGDNGQIDWSLIILVMIIMLVLIGLLLWFLLFYRRYYDVIKPTNVNVIGKERVHRKSEYVFTVESGFIGIVSYRIGDEGVWKTLLPSANGEYVIPKGEITDNVTIECR